MVLPKDIAKVLSGTWLFLNNTVTYFNGTPVDRTDPVGQNPVGLLHYDPSGYMLVNIVSTNPEHRPPGLTYPSAANQTDADWAVVAKSQLSYAGNLSATPDSTPLGGTLIHGPLLVANVPSWTGTEQTRNFTVYPGNGKQKTILMLWIKVFESQSWARLYWEKMDDGGYRWH